MNNYIRPSGYNILPPVTKNLLIINGIVFLAYFIIGNTFNINLNAELGLYNIVSDHFKPVQIVTHMFLHADFTHLLFNMFALWMFGSSVENLWGGKKFLIFYLVTGLGAAFLHQVVGYIRIQDAISTLPPGIAEEFLNTGSTMIDKSISEHVQAIHTIDAIANVPAVGASGAIYGVLLAFGMMFPNALIYLYFAIPIKAKWLVIGYGAIELFSGLANQAGDNVAHFAHLGGMIFGYFLIRYWRRSDINKRRLY